MADPKAVSKKRKREPEQPGFALAAPSGHNPGPLLVVYPALQPPASTPFNSYAQESSRSDVGEATAQVLIAGETDQIEYVTNEDESRRAADSGCRYILAVHNKRTGATALLPSSVRPQILKQTVKALKSIKTSDAPTTTEYVKARTTLGETFGTKKAKAAIRAQERNRVDVAAMEGVMDYVMEGIEKGAEGLMTAEEVKEITGSNRLIPPFSATATEPDSIYPLHNIIPENEWKALSLSALDETTSDKERAALLPYARSQWVNAHMRVWGKPNAGKDRKKNLRLLLYISALFAFRNAVAKHDFNPDQIRERLAGVPSIVLDGLFSRFTEKARGSASYHATSATKTFLLTNLFSLCLKLDNFATNTETLSHDLSLSKDEVNRLFRSLGCRISTLSERERARLGVHNPSDTKYAVLTTPLVFPKPRQKRRG